MYIVTGMHRSGTSLIAQLLFNLNLDFGPEDELLPGNRWNPKGYYENQKIVDLNNRFILGNWAGIDNWIAAQEQNNRLRRLIWNLSKIQYLWLPSSKRIARRAESLQDEMTVQAKRFKKKFVKDARFSLTVGNWIRLTEEIDSILYCYRHPLEVALSIKKREGLPLRIGYHLWTQHVKRFFEQVESSLVTMVDYNGLFEEQSKYREMAVLYSFAAVNYSDEDAQRLLDATLVRKMRHSIGDDQQLPEGVRNLYYKLKELHEQCGGKPYYSKVSDENIV